MARDDRAGRLEPVRLGLRFGPASPDRSEHGVPLGLGWAEGRLVAGSQRLGPWRTGLSVDHEGERAELALRVTNDSMSTAHLESVVLGFRWLGADASSVRFLKNGWQSWSETSGRLLDDVGEPRFPSGPWLRGLHHPQGEPPADRAGWHESSLVSVARDAGGAVCLAGVLEAGRSSGLVYWRRDPHGIRVEVELLLGVPLAPGESVEVEPVRVALGADESALLESFAETLGRRGAARTGATLPTGWCSWYQFFHEVTEDDVLRNLEALAKLRSSFRVAVVQIDDGYQRAIGDWLETSSRFPRGLAWLAGEIRAAGFRPGLWTAPFCVVPESRLFEARPEWLLRSYGPGGGDEAGEPLHRGLLHPSWSRSGCVHTLDPTRDDVRQHLLETFRSLVGMGFDYLKLDFLYVVAMQARAADPRLTAAARLRGGLEAIREGATDDAFLLGCGCPLGPAVGVVDAMRIGPDVAPHWEPPANAPAGIEATLPSARSALRSVLARAWMHRRLWINDPDCLMARTGDTQLSSREVDALAGAIAATGGMVVVSDDLPALGEEDLRRIRDTVAAARQIDAAERHGAARARGLVAEGFPEGIETHTASTRWLYLVNPAEEARVLELDDAEPGPPCAPLEAVRGEHPDGTGRLTLPPHGSSLLRAPRLAALGIFCDYDGTFAVQDVGSTLARRHARERREELWQRLTRGELTPWAYNMELLDGLELPEPVLEAFLRTVEPTPGARELVRWCEDHGAPFRVLSDGFDRNLDRLQELHGVRFAYESNHLWYERGRWRIAPGGPDPSCRCGTGLCKRARIEAFRSEQPQATVVHIGNGRVSDLCAAETADLVFAKDTLADELRTRGLPFEPFRDLHDVVAALELRFGRASSGA